MPSLIYDIETGPLPWDQIASLYVPSAALPPWDDSMVKYGNTTDPAKRKVRYDEVKAKYLVELAAEKSTIDADRSRWASEAALSPVTGQVLAIAIRVGEQVAILGEDGESESDILAAWWNLYLKYASGGRFIGYCSNMFDFPFLVWRSYFHQVVVPESAWDKTGRYPAYSFIDLIDKLPKRGFAEQSRKLTDVCKWLGIGQKPDGVDGGDFARLWAGNVESRQQALSYLENDLELTWKLAERMGVIQ